MTEPAAVQQGSPDTAKLPQRWTYFGMHKEGQIYVDKTMFAVKLARQNGPFLLTRPRRHGKSMMLQTLKSLFSRGLEDFEGLYAAKPGVWTDHTYPVVHMDFSTCSISVEDGLEHVRKNFILHDCGFDFCLAGLWSKEENEKLCSMELFRQKLQQLPERSVVLLIDEYEAPLTYTQDNPKVFAVWQQILSEFYEVIVSCKERFRFCYLTGIVRFTAKGLGSAFGEIQDLTFDPEYSSIVGFTLEEVEKYFHPYLEDALQKMRHRGIKAPSSYAALMQELKEHYTGWKFTPGHTPELFNTWDLVLFLNDPKYGFRHYWLESGGNDLPDGMRAYFTALLSKMGQERLCELIDFNDSIAAKLPLTRVLADQLPCASPAYDGLGDLFKFGYLTLDKNSPDDTPRLCLSNLAIKNFLTRIMIQIGLNKGSWRWRDGFDCSSDDCHEFLKNDQPQMLLPSLQRFFADFSKLSRQHFAPEIWKELTMQVLRGCGGFKLLNDSVSLQGQTCAVVKTTDGHCFIFGFAVADCAEGSKEDKAAKAAQIKDNLAAKLAAFKLKDEWGSFTHIHRLAVLCEDGEMVSMQAL
ncbi:MAG: AAA family ATPase [Proteobacteria bacterium]|uniref:AAA family ATPase n=1 Tax=Candidatus Avisuccinivibrio stercorigallinarum TaxID=2840704 RepID=A0A9D9GQP0_9GAMM|nr:AAA family ATPase [Candidatus Avisuccinivibrio stercorigallinarum]